MSKMTKTAEDSQLAAHFECDACGGEFAYGPGFPDYCPECGEEVTELVRAEQKGRER